VELESTIDEFKAQGLGVAAISYDTPEILEHFAQRMGGFSYPLLSDAESTMIRAFGIMNRNVAEGEPLHGMARPGTFVVDADGVVTSKYFEPGHRQRVTAESVLIRDFGAGGGTRMVVDASHLRLTAYPAQDTIRPGSRVTLVMELDLPEKMHAYAPGVEGYRPVSVSIPEMPYVRVHATSFPESEIIELPAIGESVPVYHGQVRILQDVTISPRYPGFDDPDIEELEIPATFFYQACDDVVCYIPSKIDLTFNLKLVQHDTQRVPEDLQKKAESSGS
jgi:hypothetical protein